MSDPTEPAPALAADALTDLTDLLHLHHDAAEAYALAIGALTNVGRRETLVRFRGDHERRMADLSQLVQRHGGTIADGGGTRIGAFKRAMQRIGTLGGDREVMLAFKANAAQARDRYAAAVARGDAWPEDVQAMLRAAADDEARHLEWAEGQIETLGGAPAPTPAARVASAVERVQARFADGIERAEAGGRRGLDAARRRSVAVRERLPEPPSGRVLAVGVAAAVVGFAVTTVIEAARRRR